MAVQAQYPSNVLSFHRTTDPEMKKTINSAGFAADVQARQMQQGTSGFLDQSHARFFSAGIVGGASNHNSNDISSNNHPRKRAREAAAAAEGVRLGGGSPTVLPAICSQVQQQAMPAAGLLAARSVLAPVQPKLPQLLMTPSFLLGGAGLSQLHTQQQQTAEQQEQHEEVPISVVSTGLRLSLKDQPEMQPQRSSGGLVPPLSDELAAQIKQHREEIDRLILVQGEHLHRSIAESRRRHLRSLMSAAEESASRKLREKQTELDRASRTRSDLEARTARLTAEAAAWQARARAGEAAAAALRAQLDRAADERAHTKGGGATDGERGGGSDAASACVDPRREEMERQQAVVAAATASTSSRTPAGVSPVPCRQCGSAGASVVLLPCRHLCLCASCSHAAEALPTVCPVCFCARSVAVEVFFC